MRKIIAMLSALLLLAVCFCSCGKSKTDLEDLGSGAVLLHADDADYTLVPYDLYFLTSGGQGTYVVRKIENVKGDKLTIPALCNGKEVTVVAFEALVEENTVREIEIPDTVVTIENAAFLHCENVERIVLGKNVRDLERASFARCFHLQEIRVSDDNGQYTVQNDCLIDQASKTLVKGTANSVIPDGITEIGDFAFDENQDLCAITIPESVEKIGDCAFYGTSNLKTELPHGVKWIGEKAFAYSGITGAAIPDSVERIGEAAFAYSGITDAVIPEGVTELPQQVFMGCANLRHVSVGAGVASICANTFMNCASLSSIEVSSGNAKYRSEQSCIIERDGDRLIACGNRCEIADSVRIIDAGAVSDGSMAEPCAIVLPDGVAQLEAYAVYSSLGRISAIYIPESVQRMGAYAIRIDPPEGGTPTKIYCAAAEQPSGWDDLWVSGSETDYEIIWGEKKK